MGKFDVDERSVWQDEGEAIAAPMDKSGRNVLEINKKEKPTLKIGVSE